MYRNRVSVHSDTKNNTLIIVITAKIRVYFYASLPGATRGVVRIFFISRAISSGVSRKPL